MSDTRFVGREKELAQLQALLDRALAGQGAVCFVTGEAGAGKTALITEFVQRTQHAHADLIVAVGVCNAQTGVGDPYLPFRELLSRLTGDVETGTVSAENASRLSGFLRVSGQAIAELGPDLIDIFVPGAGLVTRAASMLAGRAGWLDRLEKLSGREVAAADSGLEQAHLFEQYTNVLRAMAARQPLVLVLDDLQWADADSISLFFHLSRRLEDARVLLVGTYRPNDVALGRPSTTSGQVDRHPLEPVVNELKRYHGDIAVQLGDETEAEARAFVDAYLDTEPNRLTEGFRDALFTHTHGHPLFTVELLRAMQERGDLVRDNGLWVETPTLDWHALPARVEGVIGERIGRLAAELRETLTIACVEGEDFTAEVVAQVRDTDARGLVRTLSGELDKQHRLVRSTGARRLGRQRLSAYRFSHNLFQQYLYEDLDEVERSFLHEDVGMVLEELYSDYPDEVAAMAPQLARHFEAAGLDDKAQHYLYAAGRLARRQFAHTDALDYLSRALALTPGDDAETRFDILLERERVYDVQATREAQHQDLTALEQLSDGLDHRRRANVALRLANYAEVTGRFETTIERSQQAVGEAELAGATELQAAGYLHWGRALWRLSEYHASAERLERALRLFRDVSDQRGEGRTYNSLANVAADQGDLRTATDYYEMALYNFRETGDRLDEGIVLSNVGSIQRERGKYASAHVSYTRALQISKEIGDRESEGHLLINLGLLADHQGTYDDARFYCEQALQILREADDRWGEGLLLCNLALLYHHQGAEAAARESAQLALTIMQATGDRRIEGYALTNLGHALAGLAQYADAALAYQQALDLRRELGQETVALESLAGLARVALAQGDLPGSREMVEQIVAYATQVDSTGDAGYGFEGTEEPLRIYLTCYQVLDAAGDPRADEVLGTAHTLLQEQAARIDDPGLRRSFLENVPHNHEIVAAWTATRATVDT